MQDLITSILGRKDFNSKIKIGFFKEFIRSYPASHIKRLTYSIQDFLEAEKESLSIMRDFILILTERTDLSNENLASILKHIVSIYSIAFAVEVIDCIKSYVEESNKGSDLMIGIVIFFSKRTGFDLEDKRSLFQQIEITYSSSMVSSIKKGIHTHIKDNGNDQTMVKFYNRILYGMIWITE